MTPQQHKQHLLALAERLDKESNGFIGYAQSHHGIGTDLLIAAAGAATELREYAARLTPGVSDAMCKHAMDEYNKSRPSGGHYCSWDGMRAALESVFPLVDDGQAKDAARYRWLRDKQAYVAIQPHYHDLSIDKRTGWTIRLVTGHDNNFDVAVDAAMAAPPNDTTP